MTTEELSRLDKPALVAYAWTLEADRDGLIEVLEKIVPMDGGTSKSSKLAAEVLERHRTRSGRAAGGDS